MASVAPRGATPRARGAGGSFSCRPAVARGEARARGAKAPGAGAWGAETNGTEAWVASSRDPPRGVGTATLRRTSRRSDALGAGAERVLGARGFDAGFAGLCAASSVRARSSADASSPPSPPGGPGSPEWQACASLLASAGLAPAEACDRAVSLAFGWEAKDAYWMGRRKRVPASPAVVCEVLEALSAELGLSPEDVSALLKTFPHVLGLPLDLLRRNARRLEDELPPARGGEAEGKRRLAKALVARPEVLGVLIDCEGDCKGLCTRCYCQV